MFDPDHPTTRGDVIKGFGLDTPEGAWFAVIVMLAFTHEDISDRGDNNGRD